MKLIFCFLCCLIFPFCHAQQYVDETLDSILKIENQNLKIKLLVDFKKNYPQKNTALYAKICYQLGAEYYGTEKYDLALENVQKAISIQKSITGIETIEVHKSVFLRLVCYRYFEDLQNEMKDLYFLANVVDYDRYKLRSLSRLSEIHYDLGDYFKAMEYADNVINSFEIHKDENQLVAAHFQKLEIYAEMKSEDPIFLTDIEYHRQELEKRKDTFDSDDKISFYNTLGLIYRTYKKRPQALLSFQKVLENITNETSKEDMNSIHLNIGEIYSQLGKPEKAKGYYQKVLVTKDSINRSAAYNNLGYYHANSVENEIEYHQKAIKLLNFDPTIIGTSSFLEATKGFQFNKELLAILIDLSQAWIKLYQESNDSKNLQESLKTLYAIDDLISVMRLDSATKASKLFWIKEGVNSYLEAVKVCYFLNKPAEAFYFMEKNKSLYLLEQLGKIELKNQYKVPNKLLEKEATLNYEILLAKNKLKTATNNKKRQNAYIEATQKHFKFTDSLKNSFPNYYETNVKPKLITLREFQHFLKDRNTNAVEYILGETAGFGLWIQADKVHLFQLENYSKLIANISFLKHVFTNSSLTKKEVANYQKIGFEVFHTLFSWEKATTDIQHKKLAIIPDGPLYNFPFEALIVDQTPILKDNYFLNSAEVTYLNSASVSQNLYDNNMIDSNSYIGIAPVHFNSKSLIDLKNSEHIIKEIAALFPSDVQLKGNATKANFLNSSKGNSILHLNTHAGIDEKTEIPWLALHDTLISLTDIYIMNRSHDLVFLDACKTGDGKLQKGEGIESLSKAFFHAGAKSVIASQWNANENATNTISVSFFKALKEGSSKSYALRKAKLKYLENNELSGTFPYFWASLTLTGNSDALPTTSNSYYWILFVSIFFIIIYLYIKKRKHIPKV